MRKANTVCCCCKIPCYVRPGQMKVQRLWFCSRKCHTTHVKSSLLATCRYCGDSFARGSIKAQYCSRACSNKGRKGMVYDGSLKACKYTASVLRRVAVINAYGEFCAICGTPPEWRGKFLQLQVDHIDGDRTRNNLVNLRLLCPNCHTQTTTWGSRKKIKEILEATEVGSSRCLESSSDPNGSIVRCD